MIEKLATKFVEFQRGFEIIQDDDINVYKYGYTLIIEVILNVALSLIVGAFLGQIKEVIFFLCMFIPLRSFCGGYHADKTWKCIVLSNLVVVAAIAMAKIMLYFDVLQAIKIIGMIASALVIILLSPIENKNKEINIFEKKVFRHRSWGILFFEFIIEIILIYIGKEVYYDLVLISHVIQSLSLCFGYIKMIQHNHNRMGGCDLLK